MTRTLLIMLAITTICASCRPGEMEDVAGAEENLPALIQLNVRAEEQPDMLTRAVNSGVIDDLHVLVYDNNGELIGQKYQPTGGGTITVKTCKGSSCTIYAIANTGDPNFFKGYDKHPEKSLTDRIYTLAAWNGLDGRKNIPMTGMKENVNIVAGSQSLGNLEVARTAARVTLNIGVAPHSGITIKDYRLRSLPLKSYYVLRPLPTEKVSVDTNTTPGDDASKATDNTHWADGPVTAVNAASVSTDFYMFENRRGVVKGITQQKDKVAAKAPAHATYVEINGTAGNVAAKWRVYLGGDDAGNFNIKRNCTYTYNITLNDAVSADTRVTLDLSKVTDLSAAGTANCYIAPQPITWYKIKANIRGNGAGVSEALISPTNQILPANTTFTPAKAGLVWETAGHKKIIQCVLLSPDKQYLYFKTGPENGNAIIAVKNSQDKILWSWHIWRSSYNPNQASNQRTLNDGSRNWVFMDRNVGALVTTGYDARCLGMAYQYGRKDPYPAFDNEKFSTNIATVYKENGEMNNQRTIIIASSSNMIPQSVENPLIQYQHKDHSNKSPSWWWTSNGTLTNTQRELWGGKISSPKTIYDPCPVGWRVPPNEKQPFPWNALYNNTIPLSQNGEVYAYKHPTSNFIVRIGIPGNAKRGGFYGGGIPDNPVLSHVLWFSDQNISFNMPMNFDYSNYISVRCVKE